MTCLQITRARAAISNLISATDLSPMSEAELASLDTIHIMLLAREREFSKEERDAAFVALAGPRSDWEIG